MIQPCVADSPRRRTPGTSGCLRVPGGGVGESVHQERLVGREHHPQLDVKSAPPVPSPQGATRSLLESEGTEQSEGRVILLRHRGEHARRTPPREHVQRFGDEGSRETLPSEVRIHRDEIHVADRRRAIEPSADQNAAGDTVLVGDEERPGGSHPADREERIDSVEGGPCDSPQRVDVPCRSFTDLHEAWKGARPKNVPVSALRSPVPSRGARTGSRGSSGPCGRSNSPHSRAAAPSRPHDRTSPDPSPAGRGDSPSSRSGWTRGEGGTSGSCGPHFSIGRGTYEAMPGRGGRKCPPSATRPRKGLMRRPRESSGSAPLPSTSSRQAPSP